MSWYYAINQEQKGPISEEEFRQLASAGTITPKTLVWQEGMPNWVPYSESPVAKITTDDSGNPVIRCSECGGSFPPDQVIQISGQYSCAACKPIVVQKIHEGGQFQSSEGMSPDELRDTDYDSEVTECIGRGFRTYKANFFPILGTSVLVFFALAAFNMIPILSIFLSLFLQGPLFGGYWLYMVRHARKEPTAVGDAFSGFSNGFVQLMLANIVVSILIYLPLLPGGIVFGIAFAMGGQNPDGLMTVVAGVLLFVGFFGMIYLAIAWFFTMPLIIDKRMSFWPAMALSRALVSKHWWSTFGIGFVFWLLLSFVMGIFVVIAVVIAGSAQGDGPPELFGILFALGIFAVLGMCLPWLFCAYAHRYNDIFRKLAVQGDF